MKINYLVLLSLLCFFYLESVAQCPVPATVPYLEGFQSITVNNQLPSCWGASNAGVTCLTYTTGNFTGNKGAAFYYLPAGDSYFYSEGIQLTAGVTYSVSSWYRVDASPNVTWTNFSMHLATAQNSTGLVQLATTAANVLNTTFSALSTTFVVPANGIYYVAIKASSNGGTGSQQLYWDELSITIPCSLVANQPSLTGTASPTAACAGTQVTLTATGADTYNWGTGANTSSLLATVPLLGGPGTILFITYVVHGTSALTGCVKTVSVSFGVKPTPTVALTASPAEVCAGSPMSLKATGAGGGATYSWSTGQQGATISVTPAAIAAYTVTATNSSGCYKSNSIQVLVYALPVVSASTSATGVICAGDQFTLTASGANSYTWQSATGTVLSNPAVLSADASTTYTLLGVDDKSCIGKTTLQQNVALCTGLEHSDNTRTIARLYPNPGDGYYLLETGRKETLTVILRDISGRTVFSTVAAQQAMYIDLRAQPAGVYFLELSSATAFETLKVVRN